MSFISSGFAVVIAGSESAAATATTVMDRLIIFATPLMALQKPLRLG
jgi:hypothetical protein